MLVGFGVWGFSRFDGALGWVVGGGLPLLVAVLWGTYLSLKAVRPAPEPLASVIRVSLFLAAAVLLYLEGFQSWSIALVAVTILGFAMSELWPLDVPKTTSEPRSK